MQDHELRQRAVGEMHLRRWPVLPVPCVIVQWVLMVEDAAREEELALLDRKALADESATNPTHRAGRLSEDVRFVWERHSEGSTLTLIRREGEATLFLDPRSDDQLRAAIDWAEQLPAKVIRATIIWVCEKDAEAEAALQEFSVSRDELVSSCVAGGIRMWSDFRIKDGGFGRLLVAANGAEPRDLTRQVQRLQELGNYRNRALIGLPFARECWPKLDAAEARLTDLANRVSDTEERDDTLVEALSDLSLELAAIATSISFRMDATKAYARLVQNRLDELDVQPVDGFASLSDFTQRRFVPAMHTCEATTERVQRLSLRASQLSSLLRARIDTRIENQNAELLRSLERSSDLQVRLQQLVEGLSIVALSYYFLGLVALALGALPSGALPMPVKTIIGWMVIPTVLIAWLIMRTIKLRVIGPKEK